MSFFLDLIFPPAKQKDVLSAKWESWDKVQIKALPIKKRNAACWTINDKFQILGEDKRIVTERLGVNPSKKAAGSIMILGGAGSGKTNNIIYPTILKSLQNTMKPTMIVTDPKGELFDLTANTAELNGYNVINFGKSTFNPLAQLWNNFNSSKPDYDFLDENINLIANTLVSKPADAGQNSYFFDKAIDIVKGWIWLYLELKIPATDFRFSKIISQVRQLKPAGYKILLQDLPINSKAKIYLSEAAGNDTGVQSAISTAFNGLQMFLTNKIAHLTDTSTFDLNDLIFKPTILYVQFGEYKEIATLLMTLAYKYLNNYLSNNKLLSFSERPIHYIIDEFGNLPKMDFVSKIFSLDRAKNIFAMITLQSKSQLLALYGKERTQELIDSAQAIVVCSLADYELATDLSNKSGQGLREVVSVQKGKDTKTDTFAKNAFKNIQPEDFIMKKDDEMIVVFQGLKAYKFNYIPYWKIEKEKSKK